MNRFRAIARDEQGIAVVLGLVALLALTALVLAFLSISSFEPQIAANLTSATQARYLAEAGIEKAFDGLAATTDWSTALTGAAADCSTGVVAPGTTSGATLSTLTSASGTYTVLVRNDCFIGNSSTSADNLITGVARDGTGTTDTNNRLILISTGTITAGSSTASRTIKVVVKKIQLPTINGALTFPGLNSDVNFSGSSFTIRGQDTNTDLTNGTGAPVFGIAVGTNNNSNLDTVRTALANNQQNDVSGKDASADNGCTTSCDPAPANTFTNGVRTTSGDYAAGLDTSLTSSSITDFVNQLKTAADVTVNAPNPNQGTTPGYSISNVGDSCSSSLTSSTCWGTDAHPKIVYIKGDSTTSTSTAYTALDISGSSGGTGILIVENGSIDISGTFEWHGPIIVTGNNVKVRYHGGGNQRVFGTVVVNELVANSSTNLEADISGNASMYYSSQALNNVMNSLGGRRLMSLYNWQEQ
jgi:Tfp pilus assembly protein PilX